MLKNTWKSTLVDKSKSDELSHNNSWINAVVCLEQKGEWKELRWNVGCALLFFLFFNVFVVRRTVMVDLTHVTIDAESVFFCAHILGTLLWMAVNW